MIVAASQGDNAKNVDAVLSEHLQLVTDAMRLKEYGNPFPVENLAMIPMEISAMLQARKVFVN